MTDDLMDRWKQEQEEKRRAALEAIREHLARHPEIATIAVTYDGYGDSGQIESIGYYSTAPDEVEEALDAILGETDLKPLSIRNGKLDTAVENYAYAVLPIGWENDAGSFGKILLDATTLKGRISHDYRIEETEHEEFEI